MDQGERIARNEAAYRQVNEAIEAGRTAAAVQDDTPRPFACECGQLGCNQLVELTIVEYESVRAGPRRFLMVEGHQIRRSSASSSVTSATWSPRRSRARVRSPTR